MKFGHCDLLIGFAPIHPALAAILTEKPEVDFVAKGRLALSSVDNNYHGDTALYDRA
jgi:hypothetical protein